MSFPLPDNILQSPHVAFKQIMQEVQNHQNGVVSRQMQERGLHYKLNYGVNVALLKNIAKKYKQDNALAIQLWNCEIREGLLLSSLLFEAEKIDIEKAHSLSLKIDSIELIEQFALNLFVNIPKLALVIDDLLCGETHQQMLAFYAMSWGFKRKTLPSEYYENAMYILDTTIRANPEKVIRGLVFAMQALIDTSENYRENIFLLAENMAASSIESVKNAGVDFLWLNRE